MLSTTTKLKRFIAFPVYLMYLLLLSTGFASFAEIALDQRFGDRGFVKVNLLDTSDKSSVPMALIQQFDGKIVTAVKAHNGLNNDMVMIRYLADGTLDQSFGVAGYVIKPLGTSTDVLTDLVQQPDGKLLGGGYVRTANGTEFAVIRLNGDGSADSTFGHNGSLIFNFDSSFGVAEAIALQGDGKILLAGVSGPDWAVARLNSDGSFDTSFSDDGKLLIDFGQHAIAKGLALQSDGKIVLAGELDNRIALVRLTADGTLDTSFNGNGKVLTQINADPATEDDYATDVIQQQDGRLVVVGKSYNPALERNEFAIIRYNSNGSLDSTFSDDGIVVISPNYYNFNSYAYAESVIQQTDGKLVIFGTNLVNNDDIGFIRLNTDGSFDSTFNDSGVMTTDLPLDNNERAVDIIQQADGKLLALAYSRGSPNKSALVRYNADGSFDNTFGTGGIVYTIVPNVEDTAFGLTRLNNGQLLITGKTEDPDSSVDSVVSLLKIDGDTGLPDSGFGNRGRVTSQIGNTSALAYDSVELLNGKLLVAAQGGSDFGLVRYNSDGTIDDSCDGDGIVTTDFSGNFDTPQALLLQSDGKVVVAGDGGSNDFAMARYNTDGSLDTSFDGDGLVVTDLSVPSYIDSIIEQSDGKLVVLGASGNTNQEKFTVARYLTDGSLDTSFDGDGLALFSTGTSRHIPSALLQQNDGKLLLAGYNDEGSYSTAIIYRLNSDGTVDTSFADNGHAIVDISGDDSVIRGLVQQPDGKLMLAGDAVLHDDRRWSALAWVTSCMTI